MSEFSKEYLRAIGSSWKSDFSYIEELKEKKDNNEVFRICEGFGSVGIKTIADEPFLLFLDRSTRKLSTEIDKLSNSSKN